MIEYEEAAGATVRCMESELGGRRVAAQAVPYSGEPSGTAAFRFDPLEGRLQLDTWDDKQSGQKRSKLKVVGEGLQLIGSRPGGGGPSSAGWSGTPANEG